jgi:hypothetical protein
MSDSAAYSVLANAIIFRSSNCYKEASLGAVQGTGNDVPIKAEKDVIDLKTCLFGAAYRDQVHLLA